MHHPPVTGLVENATNVWDEIANIHISQGNDIRKFVALLFFSQRGSGFSSFTITCHRRCIQDLFILSGILVTKLTIYVVDYVGQFLPWHRYYVRMHELALQKLCNYRGAHPYWDELTDYTNGNVSQSPIFDPITGLGGNGTGYINALLMGHSEKLNCI